jgi:hypothetical protein
MPGIRHKGAGKFRGEVIFPCLDEPSLPNMFVAVIERVKTRILKRLEMSLESSQEGDFVKVNHKNKGEV